MNWRNRGSERGCCQSMELRMCGDMRMDMGALLMPSATSSINCDLLMGLGAEVERGSEDAAGGTSSGSTEVRKAKSCAGVWTVAFILVCELAGLLVLKLRYRVLRILAICN